MKKSLYFEIYLDEKLEWLNLLVSFFGLTLQNKNITDPNFLSIRSLSEAFGFLNTEDFGSWFSELLGVRDSACGPAPPPTFGDK